MNLVCSQGDLFRAFEACICFRNKVIKFLGVKVFFLMFKLLFQILEVTKGYMDMVMVMKKLRDHCWSYSLFLYSEVNTGGLISYGERTRYRF